MTESARTIAFLKMERRGGGGWKKAGDAEVFVIEVQHILAVPYTCMRTLYDRIRRVNEINIR